jgi:hypothetical protein
VRRWGSGKQIAETKVWAFGLHLGPRLHLSFNNLVFTCNGQLSFNWTPCGQGVLKKWVM